VLSVTYRTLNNNQEKHWMKYTDVGKVRDFFLTGYMYISIYKEMIRCAEFRVDNLLERRNGLVFLHLRLFFRKTHLPYQRKVCFFSPKNICKERFVWEDIRFFFLLLPLFSEKVFFFVHALRTVNIKGCGYVIDR